ncbi:pilus assembly protein PilO [Neobacillus sp. YIM B06451]|uniref:pilus assembly protein PilO n=1 Tax=Neobacillus sp. YIM B06451 TaxID=3070994 RepID=UPI0029316B0D|nr:pilus assembly protein PilO [Neobacillus sp. YIM B06451]
MRIDSFNKQKWVAAILGLLLIAFGAGAYFLAIQPLKDELKMKQDSLKTEEQLLAIIQGKEKETENFTPQSSTQMQYKIPVKPLVEQMILDLEKAEVVSGSKILSMAIAKDSEVAVQEETEAATGETTEGTQTGETGNAGENQEGQAEGTLPHPKSVIQVPEGVKKVTVQLSVESPGYDELEKFVSTLESMKRITVIESIAYTGGAEITSLQQKDEPLKFSITVSAFYMPDLEDLAQQLPDIGAPEPAGKRNPLSSFSGEGSEEEKINEN